jgi:uncharacterized protein
MRAALLIALLATVPASRGYVSDFANVLDDETTRALILQLRALEQDTTAEIAVVTVPSLGELSLEDYAVQMFKEWGVGQKGKNNGILVLIVPSTHDMRIEVGYGLEGDLPDGLAGEIARTNFMPKYKTGDISGGVRDGVARLVAVIRNATSQPYSQSPSQAQSPLDQYAPVTPPEDWTWVWFLLGPVAVVGILVGLGLRAKTFNLILLASVFAGIISIVARNTSPTLATQVLIPSGGVMALVGYALGGRNKIRRIVRRSSPSRGWVIEDAGSAGYDGGSSAWSDSGGSTSDHSSSSSSSSDSFGGGESGGGGARGDR